MIDEALAALGLSKASSIGAFFGSLVSLRFIGTLNMWQGASALFSGTVAAAFVSPLVHEMTALSAKTDGAVSFLIGVFGLVFGASVVKEIPSFVSALKTRIGGDK